MYTNLPGCLFYLLLGGLQNGIASELQPADYKMQLQQKAFSAIVDKKNPSQSQSNSKKQNDLDKPDCPRQSQVL